MLLNILQCTGQPPTTKNYPAPNVNGATIEKPSLRQQRTLFEWFEGTHEFLLKWVKAAVTGCILCGLQAKEGFGLVYFGGIIGMFWVSWLYHYQWALALGRTGMENGLNSTCQPQSSGRDCHVGFSGSRPWNLESLEFEVFIRDQHLWREGERSSIG